MGGGRWEVVSAGPVVVFVNYTAAASVAETEKHHGSIRLLFLVAHAPQICCIYARYLL